AGRDPPDRRGRLSGDVGGDDGRDDDPLPGPDPGAGRATGPAPDGLAGLGEAGVGYFAVWAVVGAGIYVVGAALVAAELRWPTLAPAIPIARGVALVAAGWVQLTSWKARHLACCREGRPGAAR